MSDSRSPLLERGRERIQSFCALNQLPLPEIQLVPRTGFKECAYYRPTTITIAIAACAYPCGEAHSRQWSWPGNTVDRTPYGVLAHELGHHCDRHVGQRKGPYYSEFCEQTMAAAGEPALTSYCPNPAEWFAEHFRLFLTNPALLALLRPRTFALLSSRWHCLNQEQIGKPDSWLQELGPTVPQRVLKALCNKIKT